MKDGLFCFWSSLFLLQLLKWSSRFMLKENRLGTDMDLLDGMYQKMTPLHYIVQQNSPEGGDEKESWNIHSFYLS